MGVFVQVDTNNKVKNIDIYRLYNYKYDAKIKKKLWNVINASIKKASKNWIFKDVKWKIPVFNGKDYGLVKHLEECNLKKSTMPL